ncbi:hypothetical protein BC629DRAFT_238000 [Irpex lacteus]|nr:hypothetical protein BC629DRAFT_238000 [Irpex lacteus]
MLLSFIPSQDTLDLCTSKNDSRILVLPSRRALHPQKPLLYFNPLSTSTSRRNSSIIQSLLRLPPTPTRFLLRIPVQLLQDLPCSTVTLDVPYSTAIPDHDGGEPEEPVCYTFVDTHEKPKKRRTKGLKNSTRIACTFCRRRKIRCGGPQEGGTCKSCIRLNHKGDCVFPAVSYRGQRLGGSAAKRKSKDISKHTSHSCKSP